MQGGSLCRPSTCEHKIAAKEMDVDICIRVNGSKMKRWKNPVRRVQLRATTNIWKTLGWNVDLYSLVTRSEHKIADFVQRVPRTHAHTIPCCIYNIYVKRSYNSFPIMCRDFSGPIYDHNSCVWRREKKELKKIRVEKVNTKP